MEVVRNALESIADGMALTVVRTSRSSVVRTSLDFSTGVLDSRGELVGQSMCSPTHLGGMMPALEACLAQFRGRIYPGDILATNDPYEGGSHLPDIFLFKPVWTGDRIVAYLCAMAHQTDIGGRVPGGNACDSTEIFQEGLRIPPVKWRERGELNETLVRILEKAVRVPDMVLGDIRGQEAALFYGEREYMKLVERYGIEGLEASVDELLDYTEELTRRSLSAMPDGTWSFSDVVDNDGFDDMPIEIAATVTKKADRILVDFDGTSPQCRGAIQPVFNTTKGLVYAVLRSVMGGDIPNTSGYFRPVTVSAPEGTFVNPLPPAPTAARALGCRRITHALYGAFAQMLPDRVYACPGGAEVGVGAGGYDKSRTPWKAWVQLEFHNETACGGRPTKDGIDGQGTNISNLANIPAETIEAEQPIRIEEYALVPDTEGAGRFRGGLGMVRAYRYLMDDTTVQVRADREKTPPYGLSGGLPSTTTEVEVTMGGQTRAMPGKFLETMSSGDTLRIAWPGAGGWGDPLERDPEAVLRDVVEDKVSPQRARDVYGVVVDLERRAIHSEETRRLRQQLGRSRAVDS
jgi:N-methylhydantoinase B